MEKARLTQHQQDLLYSDLVISGITNDWRRDPTVQEGEIEQIERELDSKENLSREVTPFDAVMNYVDGWIDRLANGGAAADGMAGAREMRTAKSVMRKLSKAAKANDWCTCFMVFRNRKREVVFDDRGRPVVYCTVCKRVRY